MIVFRARSPPVSSAARPAPSPPPPPAGHRCCCMHCFCAGAAVVNPGLRRMPRSPFPHAPLQCLAACAGQGAPQPQAVRSRRTNPGGWKPTFEPGDCTRTTRGPALTPAKRRRVTPAPACRLRTPEFIHSFRTARPVRLWSLVTSAARRKSGDQLGDAPGCTLARTVPAPSVSHNPDCEQLAAVAWASMANMSHDDRSLMGGHGGTIVADRHVSRGQARAGQVSRWVLTFRWGKSGWVFIQRRVAALCGNPICQWGF